MARGPATAAEVAELAAHVRDVCGRLEPDTIGLHEAVFDDLVACQRLSAGAVTRTAARYDEAGAWKRNGATSAEDDIARKTGSGNGRARRRLSTSKRLGHQAGTDRALRNGDVSDEQADDVSDAVASRRTVKTNCSTPPATSPCINFARVLPLPRRAPTRTVKRPGGDYTSNAACVAGTTATA